MLIRTTIILLILVCTLPGCRTWGGWGWNGPKSKQHMVDNFTASEPEDEAEEPATSLAKQNGRTSNWGTGLSSQSRDIEHNLGYD